MAHFDIKDLSFSYPQSPKPALRNVSLSIQPGEYVLVCGQSGSGKTTLLRHLKSILTPHGTRTGEIRFDGRPIESVSAGEQASRIGFVMQNPDDQIVTDKVWHELAFGLENLGCDPSTMRLRVAEMASYFGIQEWFPREVNELSGGQKQLLNLASIMSMHPDVLILDEPTSQLDPITAGDFLNTILKLNRDLGTTIILTEHRVEEIFPIADRVIVMEDGEVTGDDTPHKIGTGLYARKSVLCAALPAPIRIFHNTGSSGICPLNVREGRQWLANTFRAAPPTQPALAPEPPVSQKPACALRVKDVWLRYEKHSPDVLKELNFSVPEASIHAIVGGNGTGKTTMLKTLCGTIRPYRGSIEILGKPLRAYKNGEQFRNGLTMMPQDPHCLFVKDTVEDDLKEMTTDFQSIRDTAELCEITHLLASHPRDLSGGELQRAALAKVLLTNPRLLLLDEPTKGIDCAYKQRFAEILHKLKSQGVTVVLVSHDVEFCAEYVDQVSMFFDGQVLTTDTPRRFFGSNSFYTTAANRMSRSVFHGAVTVADVTELYQMNTEARK